MEKKLQCRCWYILTISSSSSYQKCLFKEILSDTPYSWQSEIKSSHWPSFSHTKGLQVLTMLSTPVKWKGVLTAVGGMGYWHPWAIFLAENHPQQANTAGKQWPAIKRKLSPSQSKKNGGFWAFPIQNSRLQFWVKVGEKLHCSSQSYGVTLQFNKLITAGKLRFVCLPFGGNQMWVEDKQQWLSLGRSVLPLQLDICFLCKV